MARRVCLCAFLGVFLVLALAGCTLRTRMADDKGQVVDCGGVGFGVIGLMITESMRESCVDGYQQQGFHQASDASSPNPAAATGPAKQQ